MKQLILILIFVLSGLQSILAQDIIIRKDGSEVQANVLEVNPDQVKYKRFDNQDGPVYSEYKSRILKIKYANGSEDIFVKEVQEQIVWQQPAIQEKKARNVRYSGTVEASPFLGLNYSDKTEYYQNGSYVSSPDGYSGLAITTTHGVLIKDKYFIGLGVGLNFLSIEETFWPIYITFRLDLSSAPSRPFLGLSIGAQYTDIEIDTYDTSRWTTGLWSNIMFGYKFNNKFYLAGGLTVQNAYRDGYWTSTGTGDTEVYGTIGAMASFGLNF